MVDVAGVAKREKKIGRGGKPYVPAEAGDGVAFEDTKIKPAIMKRIEALGVMNDRRVAYVAAGDGESLLKLADEYDKKKMPVMAESVRREAYECGGTVEGGRSEVTGRRSKVEGRGADAADVHKRTDRADVGGAGVDV